MVFFQPGILLKYHNILRYLAQYIIIIIYRRIIHDHLINIIGMCMHAYFAAILSHCLPLCLLPLCCSVSLPLCVFLSPSLDCPSFVSSLHLSISLLFPPLYSLCLSPSQTRRNKRRTAALYSQMKSIFSSASSCYTG